MSILDQIVNTIKGSAGGAVVAALLQHEGGVEAVIAKFKNGGLSEIVSSWIGTGENKSISADQIKSVLGNDTLTKLASKIGLDPEKITSHLANALPEIIDKLTPNGKLSNPEVTTGGAHV